MNAQERLKAFEAIIPDKFPEELKDDFAARLHWDSWQAHLKELKEDAEKE